MKSNENVAVSPVPVTIRFSNPVTSTDGRAVKNDVMNSIISVITSLAPIAARAVPINLTKW